MTDPLSRATRALRDKYDATNDEGDPATRDRVIERAVRDGRERRMGRLVLLPIAATFVLFATWAAATGRLPTFLGGKSAPEAVVPPEAPSAMPAPQPPSAVTNVAHDPEPTPIAPPAAPDPIPSVAHAPSSPTVSAAASHEPKIASVDDELYAAAHAAHFEARDYPRALAAWDAYLAKAPAGRFAPEARYNRALCLARLGRTDEAKAALRPFASGAMGGYRRDEATKLVERLGDAN